jgi:hypothetical protein
MKTYLTLRNCLKTLAFIGLALVLPLTASAQQNSGAPHDRALAAAVDVDQVQTQTGMAAQQPDQATMAAIQAETRAGQALQAANRRGDDQARERAREQHRAAEMHAEALMAQTCGTTSEQIAAMRNQGMGWGQIARNIGVHPGTLGLGHDAEPLPSDQAEMRQTAARNMETGRSTMHDDRSGAANMSGANGSMLQRQEQNHSRNSIRSHMSGSSAGNLASHGRGHHH